MIDPPKPGSIANIVMVCAGAAFLRGLLGLWWDRFKTKQAASITPLASRGGSFVPWGPVEKIRHYGGYFGIATLVWAAFCMAVLIVRP
jgi:hypothetical protein